MTNPRNPDSKPPRTVEGLGDDLSGGLLPEGIAGARITNIPPEGRISPLRVSFTVLGEARPAGSKRVFLNRKTGKPIVTDSSGKAGKTWRQDVQLCAREALAGRPPLAGALELSITFYRARPRAHYGTGRNAAILKHSAPFYPTTRPDATKLVRAVEDALTGIVWADDAQVVTTYCLKRYSETPRVDVEVRCLETEREDA